MRAALVILSLAAINASAGTHRPWAFSAPARRAAEPELHSADPAGVAEGRAALERAIAAMDRGDIPAAGTEINAALAAMPGDGIAYGIAARIRMLEGNFGLSMSMWRHILDRFPEHAPARASLGAALLYANRAEEAEREIRAALRSDPADRTARFYSAVLAARGGRSDAVAAEFRAGTAPEIRQFALQMSMEQPLLAALLGPDGASTLAYGLIGSPPGGNPGPVLRTIADALGRADDAVRAQSWSSYEAALRDARKAGLANPAIDFDIAYAIYWQNTSGRALDVMQAIVAKSENADIAARFTLFCLQIDEAGRAARVAAPILERSGRPDAPLLRAAIRHAAGDTEGAWSLLESIDPLKRKPLSPWFAQPQPAIRALRSDPRFAAWIGSDPSAPAPDDPRPQ